MSGSAALGPGSGSATDTMSRQELTATVNRQAEQLRRYETRLRDVVTAYKGLVKQKEALESSLGALNKSKDVRDEDDSLAALTLSLSTLTAEKTRLEEAFQADKRITKEKYERMVQELRDELKNIAQQHQAEVNNVKAKLAYEVQEREKERADHTAIIKELQIRLNSERKTKEKLDDKFSISAESQEMEKRVRDLSGELEAATRRLARAEARCVETPHMLVRLQEKMALLQQSHAAALTQEQIKAMRAEETARRVCASQEERVAELEAKVVELSRTVGEYSAQRHRDQLLIQHLKDNINTQILEQTDTRTDESSKPSETDNEKLADTEYLQNLIDKIHILKQELITENSKLGSPVDVASLFHVSLNDSHAQCKRDIESITAEFELYKRQLVANNSPSGGCGGGGGGGGRAEVERLSRHVEALEDKLEELTEQLLAEQRDKEDILQQCEQKLSRETRYHAEVTGELRARVVCVERQLATQRERYAALLAETDRYLRAATHATRGQDDTGSKDLNSLQQVQDTSAPPHMLHYAQELARKDLDMTQLRRDKHTLEAQLRDTQRDATIDKERMKEVVRNLKQEIDRLRRIQSREGANLEYLKNVVLSYLQSTDSVGRRHMLNAIATVLHFTAAERTSVRALL